MTPWTAAQHARLPCPSLSPRVCSKSIGLVIPSNHHILCHPFCLLPSLFLSIKVFTYSYQVAKVLKLQLHTNSSSEYSGLISFGIDWSRATITVKWSEVKSLSRVWLFATLWTVAHQAPPSMGFSRQEYWSGLAFPSPGDLPTQGSNPGLLHWRQTL